MKHYIIFDLDSTLVTIEGIDWLARRKGVEAHITTLTDRAMNGEAPFEDVLFERLRIIRPTYDDLVELGYAYCRSITPGAIELIRHLHRGHREVFVISGGYNPAVQMVTRKLGIHDPRVFANKLLFAGDAYQGVDRAIPLWRNDGKRHIVAKLRQQFTGKFTMIGDGMSDLTAGVDEFICFAGVAARPSVIAKTTKIIQEKSLTGALAYL